MAITELNALSLFDGRYRKILQDVPVVFSESSLISKRIEIELKYLLQLSKKGVVRKFTPKEIKIIEKIFKLGKPEDRRQKTEDTHLSIASSVKGIEEKTKHDVKAVELFLRKEFDRTSLRDLSEKLHYCLTSEDVNNLAYRLMLKDGVEKLLLPELKLLIETIRDFAIENRNVVMMARTHGQDAVPVTFGKEISVFAVRLSNIYEQIKEVRLTGKINGAVGAWNSFHFAEPGVNWLSFSREFVEDLGLEFNPFTTQINPYDDVVQILNSVHTLNSILIDYVQDIWRYISDGWIKQRFEKGEVGSSTMSQKVNPISFENAEGNLQMGNGTIEVLQRTLPISRLQRDLSNSTLIRNLSHVFAYQILALRNILRGMGNISVDKQATGEYLDRNWSVLAEPLQTFLRKKNYKDSYELIKAATMGSSFSRREWIELLDGLEIDEKTKGEIKSLNLTDYIGISRELVDLAVGYINKKLKNG